MSNSIGSLNPADRAAVFESAKRLGLDPYEFGAVIHKESGFQPNIWGGAGGGYYGLIQFGGPERSEAGLDPAKIGKYTIREQLPHVEKWLAGRGYKPGMGVEKLYATILGGNPNANVRAQDAFGTSVAGSLQSFLPGGFLYQRAQKTLGDPMYGSYTSTSLPGTSDQASVSSDSKQQVRDILKNQLLSSLLGGITASSQSPQISFPTPPLPSFDEGENSQTYLTPTQNKENLSKNDIMRMFIDSGRSYTDQTTDAIRNLAIAAQEAFKPGKSVF